MVKPEDVIERYKEVKDEVDEMDTETISKLAEDVAYIASAMKDPSDDVIRNVVSFFEQDEISPEVRHLGIRDLAYGSMHRKVISKALAIKLANELSKLPKARQIKESDHELVLKIHKCSDLEEIEKYEQRDDLSDRVRKEVDLQRRRIEARERYKRDREANE